MNPDDIDLAAALFHPRPGAQPQALARALAASRPDMHRADPAGRGPAAQASQWIADLVALSMASVHAKDGEGRVHPVAGASRAWFLGLAASLASVCPPKQMLAFDGREPWDRLPLGGHEGQFKRPDLSGHPDLLSALTTGPHLRIPSPELGESVASLIEHCLQGVELSPQRARQALQDLIDSGHFKSSWPREKTLAPQQLRRAAKAIASACPSLSPNDLGWDQTQIDAWLGSPPKPPKP